MKNFSDLGPGQRIWRVIWVGYVVVLMFMMMGDWDDRDSPTRTATRNTPYSSRTVPTQRPPTAVTARELFAAYDANEVAAQRRFDGNTLAVTGAVESVELDFWDEPVIRFETPNMFLSVSAHFDDAHSGAASRVNEGQQLTVVCERVSEIIGAPQLHDCRIGQ